MRKDNSFADSPRNDQNSQSKHGGNGSASNLRGAGTTISDQFFDFNHTASLVGIYEDGKHSPEVSRINHFLPDNIKGVMTSPNTQASYYRIGQNNFRGAPFNVNTVGGAPHETATAGKSRNHQQ